MLSALDINQASDTGNTALHAAANAGNVDVVKVLCRSPDISVNCLNPQCENSTPLHLAVMHGAFGDLTVQMIFTVEQT